MAMEAGPKSELELLKEQVTTLVADVSDIRKEFDRLQKERDAIQKERDELATLLQEKESEKQRLRAELDALRAVDAAEAGDPGAGDPRPAEDADFESLLNEVDAEERQRIADEAARRAAARQRHATPPTDDSWWITRAFKKTAEFIDKEIISGVTGKDGVVDKVGKFLATHMVTKAALLLLTRMTGTGILVSAPEYIYHRNLSKEQQGIVLEALLNLRKGVLGLDEGQQPTQEPWGDAKIQEETNNILHIIDESKIIADDYKAQMKGRVKLLVQQAGEEPFQWERQRFEKEVWRLVMDYIVNQSSSTEIVGDLLAPELMAMKALMYRGISSAFLSWAARKTKEQRDYERTRVSVQEAAKKASEDIKRSALEKAKHAFSAETLTNDAYFYGAAIVGGTRDWLRDISGSQEGEQRTWRHRVRGLFTTLRVVGIARAAMAVPEMDPSTVIDRALQEWQQYGILRSFRDNALFSLEQTPFLGRAVKHLVRGTGYAVQNLVGGNGYDWVGGHVVDHVDPPPQVVRHAPVLVEPAPHVEVPPPVGFYLNKIHGLSDIGMVNTGTYMKIFVHLWRYNGMHLEFKDGPVMVSGRTIMLPHLVGVNGHGIAPTPIDSQKTLDSVLDNPKDPFVSVDAPIKNVAFDSTIQGDRLHRLWAVKDGTDLAYELRATTVYQDAETRELYTLDDGTEVRHPNDILQSKHEKFEIVGIRTPDGELHAIAPVALNDPLHGKFDCNSQFQSVHSTMVESIEQQKTVDEVFTTAQAPASGAGAAAAIAQQHPPADPQAPRAAVTPKVEPAPQPAAVAKAPIQQTAENNSTKTSAVNQKDAVHPTVKPAEPAHVDTATKVATPAPAARVESTGKSTVESSVPLPETQPTITPAPAKVPIAPTPATAAMGQPAAPPSTPPNKMWKTFLTPHGLEGGNGGGDSALPTGSTTDKIIPLTEHPNLERRPTQQPATPAIQQEAPPVPQKTDIPLGGSKQLHQDPFLESRNATPPPPREGVARAYSGISASRAYGRMGTVPFRVGSSGGLHQSPWEVGEKRILEGMRQNPYQEGTNDIRKDMLKAMRDNTNAAEQIFHDPSTGHYSATSPRRLAQTLFDKDLQTEHNIGPRELDNIKGNLRYLIEGKNIVRGGTRMIGHEEFCKAIDITHPGHKQWGAAISNETEWKNIVQKLVALGRTADHQQNLPPSEGAHTHPSEHQAPPPTKITAPDNLPLEPQRKGTLEELADTTASAHHPDYDATQEILQNNTLSSNEKFRAITRLLRDHGRSGTERFLIPLHGTNATEQNSIIFTKLHEGRGIFVRMPGESFTRHLLTPERVAMIEKLLRK
ncbi:hypothetical protein HZA86_01420 [Candidatus Uhrbacteria bacterium]|nr:hypothetical protein [Candidatus Uhrbacteria bacterium]